MIEYFYLIIGLTYLYVFLLDNNNKINLSMFFGVHNKHKRVLIVETLSRLIFLLLVILVVKYRAYLNYISLVLVVISLAIFYLSKKTMQINWATNINDSQQTLTTNGIFKYSRNPVYIAYHILFISMLFVNLKIFIVVYIIFTIIFHLLILEEEKYLKDKFKDEYTNYSKRVRRYL